MQASARLQECRQSLAHKPACRGQKAAPRRAVQLRTTPLASCGHALPVADAPRTSGLRLGADLHPKLLERPNVNKRKPLKDWLKAAEMAYMCSNPAMACKVMGDMSLLDQAEVAERPQETLHAAQSQMRAGLQIRGMRRATLFDSFASGVAAHEAVHAALHADKRAIAAVHAGMLEAAQSGESYRNALCAAQMATAQGKLGLYCPQFWDRLSTRDLAAFGAQEVGILVHRAGTLCRDATGPQPSAQLWSALAAGVAWRLPDMDAQALANCHLSMAYTGLTCDRQTMQHLWACTAGAASDMVPQNVSNTLWACAARGAMAPEHALLPLLQACARLAPAMDGQEISNSTWALARLGKPTGPACAAAFDAALHAFAVRATAAARVYNCQQVANVIWAWAELKQELHEPLKSKLAGAAASTAADMTPQQVANTLVGWAKLHQRLAGPMRTALLRATEQMLAADSCDAQAVANSVWALAFLKVTPSQTLAHAISTALLQYLPLMPEAGVTQVFVAFALWQARPAPPALAAMTAAVQAQHGTLGVRATTHILQSCAALKLQDSAELRQALCSSVAREGTHMGRRKAERARVALAQLAWPEDAAMAAALDAGCAR